MEPSQINFWAGALASVITALGGAKGVSAIVSRVQTSRRDKRAEAEHVKTVRADNEVFKTEMREGLRELKSSIQRIDANLRSNLALDERPIMDACDDGLVQFINPAFTRELGWTIDQMRGTGWINAVADIDQKRIREQWHAAVTNGDFLLTEAMLKHRDGHLVGRAQIEAQPRRCIDDTQFGWTFVLRLKRAA